MKGMQFMTTVQEIVFLLVLFGANVIQGITGFAGTLLAMPPSILLIGPDKAKAVLNIMAVVSSSLIVCQSFCRVDVHELLKITAAMMAGMMIGIYVYDRCPLSFLLPVYGAFIIAVGLRNLRTRTAPVYSRRQGWAVLLGAGIVHGLFVSGGALLVLYAAATFKDKDVFRSTLSAVWVILNALLMGKDYFSHVYDSSVMMLTVVGIVPLLGAICLGTAIHRRIDQTVFMKLSYGLLIISGAVLCI